MSERATLITLGEDITARKSAAASLRAALDQAEQASQAKTAFLANMIMRFAAVERHRPAARILLSKGALDPRGRELVDIILSSGRSLERLLSDILDLVRAGRSGGHRKRRISTWATWPIGRRALRAARRGKGVVLEIQSPRSST